MNLVDFLGYSVGVVRRVVRGVVRRVVRGAGVSLFNSPVFGIILLTPTAVSIRKWDI